MADMAEGGVLEDVEYGVVEQQPRLVIAALVWP